MGAISSTNRTTSSSRSSQHQISTSKQDGRKGGKLGPTRKAKPDERQTEDKPTNNSLNEEGIDIPQEVRDEQTPKHKVSIQLLTQNVRGLKKEEARIQEWFDGFKRQRDGQHVDIVLLQETRAKDDWTTKLENLYARSWGYQCERLDRRLSYWTTTPTAAGGVAMLLHPHTELEEVSPTMQELWSPHFIAVKAILRGEATTIVGVYAPVGRKKREELFTKMAKCERPLGQLFMGGDFNCTLDVELDRTRGGRRAFDSPALHRLLEAWDLVDADTTAMLEAHTSSQIASYRASKHTFMYTQKPDEIATCRLDRWYVDRLHFDQVDDVAVHTPVSRSDHDAVLLRYGPSQSQGRQHKRRARRRQLLKYPIPPCARTTVKEISEECLRQLDEVIDELDAEKLAAEWDNWKTRLRSRCLRAKRDRMILHRHQRGLRRRRIEKELRNVRRRANEPAAAIPATVEGITHAMEQMTLDKAARATRLREQLAQLNVQKSEHGRNRRFGAYRGNSAAVTVAFFKRISTKFQRRRQVTLPHDPASNLNAPEQMAVDWKHITQQAQVDKSIHDTFFMKLGTVPPLSGMGQLLRDFNPGEVSAAIRSCPRGKSSGPDGIPNDWYREHEELLAPILADVYNKWFEHGIVPDSFQQAIICCLPKTKKPKSGLDYRPIALLNTDYKIYSRLLLNRVRPLLANLVSPLQFGFVPDRQVHDAIDAWTAAQRLVSQGTAPKESVALLLDFAKAYDTLDREFLYAVLTRLGFPDKFVTTVRQLHRNTTAAYLVDGELSSDHQVTNGIRQGCPLAPVLFILAVDTLHEMFSRSTELRGIEITENGQRMKSVGFADDTTVYIQGPHEEKPVLEILQEFGDASGLRINMGKCIAVCLDSNGPQESHNAMQIQPIKAGQHVRYLGIQVASQVDKDHVWTLTLQQIRSRLHLAEMKTTNTRQRAKIVKAVVMPKVLFVARHQCPTSSIIAQIQRFIGNYVWQGSLTAEVRAGRAWMSRQTAALPGASGGLGLPLVHEECLLTSAKTVLRWARPIPGIRGAIGTALLNGTPVGGPSTNAVSITRAEVSAPRLNKNFATTGVSTLRSITAQPRGEVENRIQAELCAKPETARTDRRWWNDGWYHADFSDDHDLLFALLNEQHARYGPFNKGGLMIARALGDGVLATVDSKSERSRPIEKSDFPNLLKAHDRIQDVLEVTWHGNYTLRFKARRHEYPMAPVLVREFRRFCEIIVYNYPDLLYAREEPEDLCLHTPSHDTWKLKEATDGFILEVVTMSGNRTILGSVTTRIEAQGLARMHLDDRKATFELHPWLDAFVPIWNHSEMEQRPTLKQKIYRRTTERAEREAVTRTERLRAEDDAVGNALADLEWTTITRLRHATEGQKLLIQRIKGGRISGWDRLHQKRGCPHCEEDGNGGRVAHIFWHCPKAKALWAQLEDAWTPSGKGWEQSHPRQFCQDVFRLSLSVIPTGLWDWEQLHPSTIDTAEVTVARAKITDLWKQHVLVTLNVIWQWRNGMHDEDRRWSDDQASAIHSGAIRTETQCLQRDLHETCASRRLGWNILKKLKTQNILEREPRPNERATARFILYFNSYTDQKLQRSRAGIVVVQSTEMATDADIVWSTSMSLTGTTSNEAMYEGLITGLTEAQKKGWTPLEVVGSNTLVHQQMSKHKPPKKKRLLGFYAVARRLADTLGVRHWHHHQNEFNRMARAAATHEVINGTSATTHHPTERPDTTLATYLSGDHARWQSNHWSRTLAA